MARKSAARIACSRLRKKALAYPEAVEDSPWGDPLFKVRGKIFLFLDVDQGSLCVTAKLPDTSGIALMLPNVEPTGYNLGRSGWVSATFAPDEEVPLRMLEAWIDESYRVVAPKKLVKLLDAPPAGGTPRHRARRTRARRGST
jgi:predicted DNA-binding protein (MmcQ/YjbR family)